MRLALTMLLVGACGPALDVPSMELEAVVPPAVCAGGASSIAVRGRGFTPLVVAAVSGAPRLELPTVTLIRGDLSLAAEGVRFAAADRLELPLPAEVTTGLYDVRVANPGGGQAELTGALELVDAPRIDGLAPARTCAPARVRLRGAGLVAPTVRVGATAFPGEPAECAGATCGAVDVDLPAGMAPGEYVVTVANGAGATCPGEASAALTVAAAPRIDAVIPDRCPAPTVALVRGVGFDAGARARLGGVERAVTVDSSAQLRVALLPGDLDVAGASLVVENPDGCATETAASAAGDLGAPFLLRPPAVPAGVAVEVVAYLRMPAGGATAASLIMGSRRVELGDVQPVPGLANALRLRLPPLAAGVYDVVAGPCGGRLAGGLTVADPGTLVLGPPQPAWAPAQAAATLALGAVDAGPAPMVYAVAGATARPLQATEPPSAGQIALRAPPLAAGVYDLLAVTADGRAGVLPAALAVTDTPVPAPAAVLPTRLTAGTAASIVVSGAAFSDEAEVALRCEAGDVIGLTVTSRAPDTITASTPASLPAGSVCAVRVANGPIGAPATPYVDLPAVVVASEGLVPPFVAGPSLGTARRAPAAAVTGGFLHVVGGDGGSEAGALASVETSKLDPFGRPGPFVAQRGGLTTPRSFAAAVAVGDRVLILGGSGPGGALATVEEARLLDGSTAPVPDVPGLVPGAGPAAGAHVYRVSALLPVDGESLPSDPVVVILPAGTQVTLRWRAVAGALAYRVYRDGGLLGEVSGALAFDDDGSRGPSGEAPLARGALGDWHLVAPRLSSARQGLAAAAVASPAGGAFVYAGGGAGTGFAGNLDSYEVATVAADGSVGPFLAGVGTIGGARALLPAVVVDRGVRADIGVSYVYFLAGGRVTQPATLTTMPVEAAVAGRVGLDGQLTMSAVAANKRPGAAAAAAAGAVYALGGQAGDDRVETASICPAPGCGVIPPALKQWTNLGPTRLLSARAFMGTAVLRPFIYLAGGQGAAGPLATTERTAW